MKKRIILIAIAIMASILAYNLFQTAYLQINVKGASSSKVDYQIVDQHTQVVTSISSTANPNEIRVKRGSYLVMVKQDKTSYFAIVKAKGFLKKTVIEAQLAP